MEKSVTPAPGYEPSEQVLAPAMANAKPMLDKADAQKKLNDLLAMLWEQRKGVLLERLTVLQEAIASFTLHSDDASRKTGAETAHKLAGILGTFGLPRGTDLAREAEVMLERAGPVDEAGLRRLRTLAEELAVLIHQRSLPRES